MIHTFYSQPFPILEVDGQFILREQEIKDTPDFFAYYSDAQVGQHILADKPRNLTEAATEINYCRSLFHYKKGIYWSLVQRNTDKMIGAIGIYINNQHHRGEICYDLAPTYWNKGIITQALKVVVNYAFQKVGLVRLEALTVKENRASIAVLHKLGFSLEGTLNKYRHYQDAFHDVEMYARTVPQIELTSEIALTHLEKHYSSI